jgi:hypothetical protein
MHSESGFPHPDVEAQSIHIFIPERPQVMSQLRVTSEVAKSLDGAYGEKAVCFDPRGTGPTGKDIAASQTPRVCTWTYPGPFLKSHIGSPELPELGEQRRLCRHSVL